MVIGASEAIKEEGLARGRDILVVSIDAVPDIFAALAAGAANATVEFTPNMAGPAFDVLDALLREGTPAQKYIVTPSSLYTQTDDPAGEYKRRKFEISKKAAQRDPAN